MGVVDLEKLGKKLENLEETLKKFARPSAAEDFFPNFSRFFPIIQDLPHPPKMKLTTFK